MKAAFMTATSIFRWNQHAAAGIGVALLLAISSRCVAATTTAEQTVDDVPADYRQMAVRIDALLDQVRAEQGVEAAPTAGDGEFLRRAYLDFTGAIPRTSVVREFLADDYPNKRAHLIDQLLASPRYATHMATTWRNRVLPNGVDPERSREAMGLQNWLRLRFAKNVRYDNLVGGMLLATGGDDQLGPALYYQANDVLPEKIARSAAELFLGVKLHCAQCHDHPYEDWSQQEFWNFAAFFARVRSPGDRMSRESFRLVDERVGEVTMPESAEIVPPKYPRGDLAHDDGFGSRRMQLAIWLTSRDNPFFARAAVNWAWGHLFGRELVETVDDAGKHTPGTHAQLLDELSEYFVKTGFDLQQLWRAMAGTQAYQRSSRHPADELPPAELFAYVLAKPLTPEQLYDSFTLLAPRAMGEEDPSTAAGNLMGMESDPRRIQFVQRMRAPPGARTEYHSGTLQALTLMNGDATAQVTAPGGSTLLGALRAPFMSDDDRIEAMFLASLARMPTDAQRQMCRQVLGECQSHEDRDRALGDILWALVNSTEFAFNR